MFGFDLQKYKEGSSWHSSFWMNVLGENVFLLLGDPE